jgi:radical SAM protein with 4Fe4S-binding SPASM domain
MGLVKTLRRKPEVAREFAQCVAEDRPYRLLDVKLYLTRRCNLRCLMCNAWTGPQHANGELDTGEVKQVIAAARDLGLTNLKLFGGEPMLRQDLEPIVAYASQLGIHCTLITNGTLLSKRRAEALVTAGLTQLDLSLDARDAALHDGLRGAPGTWSRAVQGLHFVRQAAQLMRRQVTIRVNTVVMRQNYRDLPELVTWLSEQGVDEIGLNPVVPQHGNPRGSAPDYLLKREDLRRYNEEIAPQIPDSTRSGRRREDGHAVYLYGTTEEDMEQADQGRYAERLQVTCCFKPWYYSVIREYGEVVGCNTVKHPMARLGNVREASLEAIWSSEAYRAFRASCKPPQFEDCRACCYRYALVNKKIEYTLAQVASPAGDLV